MSDIIHPKSAKDRLIVALDVPSLEEARTIVSNLGESVSFYKIGYQLAFVGGLDLARELKASGKMVFLDMKLLDIDNTIEKGVSNIAKIGVDMLTVHAYPKTMRAAVAAANESDLCILGVTVLTSMDHADLLDAGYQWDPYTLVLRRAEQAAAVKMGGIVCSAEEAAAVRKVIGSRMALVTPGIRPAGAEQGDQKRVMTPKDAINAGASHLVVGRPIIGAANQRKAADAIVDEIQLAL